jgi:hypothetical protein
MHAVDDDGEVMTWAEGGDALGSDAGAAVSGRAAAVGNAGRWVWGSKVHQQVLWGDGTVTWSCVRSCALRTQAHEKRITPHHFLANPEVVAYSRRRRFTKGLIRMPFVSLFPFL